MNIFRNDKSTKLHKTKLFKLIKSLSKREFNHLEAYINSPFFLKKNKNPLKLYQALKKFSPKFDDKTLTKEVIFEEVFPRIKYSDAKMRNLLSRTVKIVDSYLLYLDNEGDEFGRDKRLSEVYNKRNIESEFFNYSRRLLADLEKVEQKDTAYYFNKFSLEKEMYFHLNNDKKNTISILDNSLHSFHNFLALEDANIKLEIYNRQRIFKQKIEIPSLSYSKPYTRDNIGLKLIKNLNDLLSQETNDNFEEIINEFENNINVLSKLDRINIYMSLQNYGVQKTSKNFEKNIMIQFKLYQIGLKYQLIIINNSIVSSSYLNIVLVGIKLKKYTWTADFIEKYEKKLNRKEAFETKKLSLIFLFYDEKKYLETINLTSKIRFTDVRWELNSKTIQIRSYFRLFQKDFSYGKLIIKQINALEKFLKREKSLATSRKLGTLNFNRILKRMTNAKIKGNWSILKENIKQEIEHKKNIAFKDWLLDVLN